MWSHFHKNAELLFSKANIIKIIFRKETANGPISGKLQKIKRKLNEMLQKLCVFAINDKGRFVSTLPVRPGENPRRAQSCVPALYERGTF
jgi:hypothetical protein